MDGIGPWGTSSLFQNYNLLSIFGFSRKRGLLILFFHAGSLFLTTFEQKKWEKQMLCWVARGIPAMESSSTMYSDSITDVTLPLSSGIGDVQTQVLSLTEF